MNGLMAQIMPTGSPRVAPLPWPPLWEQAILEQPWYLGGALAVLALIVLALLNQRGKTRLAALWGAGLLLAGAAVVAIGVAVTTEREEMRAASRALVDATARADTRALDQWLASDARLFSEYRDQGLSVPGEGLDKAGILRLVPSALSRWTLKEHRVDEVQAESLAPGVGRTQVRMRVIPEATQLPHTSWWRVEWRRSPDGQWRATEIRPLDIPYAGMAG